MPRLKQSLQQVEYNVKMSRARVSLWFISELDFCSQSRVSAASGLWPRSYVSQDPGICICTWERKEQVEHWSSKKISEQTKCRRYRLAWAVLYNCLVSASKNAGSPEPLYQSGFIKTTQWSCQSHKVIMRKMYLVYCSKDIRRAKGQMGNYEAPHRLTAGEAYICGWRGKG